VATKLKTPELSRVSAEAFAEKWKSYTDEKQHARGFWSDFFAVLCGVDDQEEAGIEYEKRVKSTISGNQEYIDVYWKNVALIEHKSAGENLDKAELQARGYWLSLAPGYRPKTIIISDFHNFRIVDIALNKTYEFPLSKLPDNIHRFEAIISGNRTKISEEEITVDQQAAKLMANLYLELEAHGFEGHETSIFLVRLLFLLFGDDTGMWSKNLFLNLVMDTKEDGTDVGSTFDKLFEVLNTAPEKRTSNLPSGIREFPYVNGNIFAEKISIIDFNKKMRKALVEVANYDWTTINPTIFGALFQMIKSKEARTELGEHYTSEENINKIVYPLFLDELQERLAKSWDSKKELKKLRLDLGKIRILDPACGSGNFLVVSYKHLRQLELELTVRLQSLEGKESDIVLDGALGLVVNLNQFYGIEIEEWPSQIARVALFLTEHQENRKLARITGESPSRFPIHDSANILNANSLIIDWSTLFEINEFTFILGNPPFIGARLQTESQKNETLDIWRNYDKAGNLDYVCNWFLKSARAIAGKNAKAAFVATNSISQGEQPPIMWPAIFDCGVHIIFAHRTFSWSNDSAGQAIVHVVIVGISSGIDSSDYPLWTYETVKSQPSETRVKNINPYLVNAPNVLISSRRTPLGTSTQPLLYGSQPNDGGAISDISPEDATNIRKMDPIAAKYLKKVVGARELLHNEERWCLWLTEVTPVDIRQSKILSQRIGEVKKTRESSERKATQELAATPHLFGFISHPKGSYLAIPLHSSEERKYVPIAYFDESTVCTNAVSIVPEATLITFGLMSSIAFNVWNKGVSGRIKNDTRISGGITYNNFPFLVMSKENEKKSAELSQNILAARLEYPNSSLAELYGMLSMPTSLSKAHFENDKFILSLYGLKIESTDAEILERLFVLYSELTETDKLKYDK
jgi:type I restriction-modification system DNA methylase subunit